MSKKENHWSAGETKTLENIYSTTSNEDLLIIFPNRTILAIYKKANALGLKKTDEIQFIDRSNGRKKIHHEHKPYINKKGYRLIYRPDHPRANKSGMVLEHIVIWEEFNNVSLPDGFIIHHINGKKSDNSPLNLSALSVCGHTRTHHIGAKRSQETKLKISEKAKEKLSIKSNHPLYKPVDVTEMISMREKGMTIDSICKEIGICKNTFYEKMRGVSNL